MQTHTDLPKVYLSYPTTLRGITKFQRIRKVVAGLVLFPLYWGAAYVMRTPGLKFRKYCALLGIRLLLKVRDIRRAYNLIVSPMDSVRYFEFDFMWHTIEKVEIHSYLDVSSPRLFPLMVVNRTPGLVADLINPDKEDIESTISWAESFNLTDRCRFHERLVDDVSIDNNFFDVITSISVIEHIPDDKKAIQKLWDLLKPGGRLLISVPCAAKASEEYINQDTYKLLNKDEKGFVYWQRYYDEDLIRKQIFSITGEPVRFAIYGERRQGSYSKNMTEKRENPLYQYWREPFMMGIEYEFRNKISELPGMGVIAMEFVKS